MESWLVQLARPNAQLFESGGDSIQHVARQDQAGIRMGSLAVGAINAGVCGNTMQVVKGCAVTPLGGNKLSTAISASSRTGS